MQIRLRRKVGEVSDLTKHLRVMCRVQAVDEVVVTVLEDNDSGAINTIASIKRTAWPAKVVRRNVIDANTFFEREALCGEFFVTLNYIQTGVVKQLTEWYIIEK